MLLFLSSCSEIVASFTHTMLPCPMRFSLNVFSVPSNFEIFNISLLCNYSHGMMPVALFNSSDNQMEALQESAHRSCKSLGFKGSASEVPGSKVLNVGSPGLNLYKVILKFIALLAAPTCTDILGPNLCYGDGVTSSGARIINSTSAHQCTDPVTCDCLFTGVYTLCTGFTGLCFSTPVDYSQCSESSSHIIHLVVMSCIIKFRQWWSSVAISRTDGSSDLAIYLVCICGTTFFIYMQSLVRST